MQTNDTSLTEILVGALTHTWRGIQERNPDVPDVILTLGSGTLGQRGAVKLGHFAAARWDTGSADLAELFVGGEGLQRGALGVLGTLLHEAAHGAAHTRGIKDTSRGGRYHNARFRTLGEELGLNLAMDGTRGWSATELGTDTADIYADEITALSEAITTYRHAECATVTGTRCRGRDRNGYGYGDEVAEPAGRRLLLRAQDPRRAHHPRRGTDHLRHLSRGIRARIVGPRPASPAACRAAELHAN